MSQLDAFIFNKIYYSYTQERDICLKLRNSLAAKGLRYLSFTVVINAVLHDSLAELALYQLTSYRQ